MRHSFTRWIPLACLAGLVAWMGAQLRATAESPRAAAASAPAAQPVDLNVRSRALAVGPSEILVLDVPSTVRSSSLVALQRCYVWRDAEFKTASLTCPSDATDFRGAPPPPSGER